MVESMLMSNEKEKKEPEPAPPAKPPEKPVPPGPVWFQESENSPTKETRKK